MGLQAAGAGAAAGVGALAGGSTAAAIAAANLAAAAAATAGATALTATATVGVAAGAATGAGATAGAGVGSAAAVSPIVPAAAAPITAPPAGGFFKAATTFLASPKGLAIQGGLSGISTVAQGFAANQEAKAAAEFSDFHARGAVLEGRRKALVELERVNKEQARQFAAIGASGILPGGSAATSALETGRKGLANVALIQTGAALQGRAASLQAENLRRRGRVAILGGFVSGSSRAARLISSGNR